MTKCRFMIFYLNESFFLLFFSFLSIHSKWPRLFSYQFFFSRFFQSIDVSHERKVLLSFSMLAVILSSDDIPNFSKMFGPRLGPTCRS